jgi:hypothetical protein
MMSQVILKNGKAAASANRSYGICGTAHKKKLNDFLPLADRSAAQALFPDG